MSTSSGRAKRGKNSSAITKIREINPYATWMHCNIQRAALASKTSQDHFRNVINACDETVNFIEAKLLQ